MTMQPYQPPQNDGTDINLFLAPQRQHPQEYQPRGKTVHPYHTKASPVHPIRVFDVPNLVVSSMLAGNALATAAIHSPVSRHWIAFWVLVFVLPIAVSVYFWRSSRALRPVIITAWGFAVLGWLSEAL